ncbi:putative ATP-binding protein [Dethiosulfovibrio peptidovorans DSM 11002]|uniref:ATP-binding protein n=1 Tax=Dethiosulfovibrio peptidovorans DSM 11002 TaxID=469381 RepID=D2Z349_9BACT|nr:ATP-binding protein [Dethiosulfovibrio peptidovorans]EFC90267.1 putative ATP-binding protein [Dethiosulfovibrio peptidovorans DSM 11002]
MLKSMDIENLTVFTKANVSFSSGLNVIVGENGTGKSHLLKAVYSLLAVSAEGGRKSKGTAPTKNYLQTAIAEKLVGVFCPESLGRLIRRRQGRARCDISLEFGDPRYNISCSFSSNSKAEVSVDKVPSSWNEIEPIFFPTRELMSLYPNFVATYDRHYLEFEETWRDTCLLLGAPLRKGPREKTIKMLLEPLEEGMGGKVVLSDGRMYLQKSDGRMEMHLVAEGHRKLAMIAHLIASGVLLDRGYLFWDEPEANLNPKLVKLVAETVLRLCKQGIQVFLATHDLFLLRELELKRYDHGGKLIRFIGLHEGEDGVSIEQGDAIEDIGDLVSLDENVDQSQRYLSMERQE